MWTHRQILINLNLKNIRRGIAELGASAGAILGTAGVVCGACFCLALAGAGGAEAPSRPLATTELLPAGDTNVIATYDGGRVSAGAVAEAEEEPRFVVEAERYAPTNAISRDEKLARHLAALQILVDEARRRGLDQAPEWRLQTKFLEQHLLREALITELLQGVLLSDEEVARYYESNKFRLLTIQAFEARRIGVQTRKHGEQARERAQEALALLRNGRDFGEVARQYSDLALAAAQTNTYPADFWGKAGALALADLGEGRVSEPLSTAEGWELVYPVRIRVADSVSREEALQYARQMLASQAANRQLEELGRVAAAAHALVPGGEAARAAGDPAAAEVIACGKFSLTAEEVQAWARQRSRAVPEFAQLAQQLKEELGDALELGELARDMGLGQRPEFQRRWRYEQARGLSHQARMVLIPEYLSGLQFAESRLADYYQDQWTGTVDARLDYDVLVVPLGVRADAEAEERAAAREQAQAAARKLIARFWEGATLEQLAGEDARLQLITGQSRLFQAGSMLEPLVAGLQPGQIALEPYEDFGGYCVIRVNRYEASRKMPYEMARPYVIEHFRREVERDLRQNFEVFLLAQKHFKFKPEAAGPAAADSQLMGKQRK